MEEDYRREIESLKLNWRSAASAFEKNEIVTVTAEQRVTACCFDILGLSSRFIEVFVEKVRRSEERMEKPFPRTKGEMDEFWEDFRRRDLPAFQELSSLLKAMYFFLRALQDACRAVLNELGGGAGGKRTSMNNCKPSSPQYVEIDSCIPRYFEWFKNFKETRDKIKYGVTQSGSYSSKEGFSVQLNVVHEHLKPPEIDIDKKVFLDDIIEALRMSNKLLVFLKERAEKDL